MKSENKYSKLWVSLIAIIIMAMIYILSSQPAVDSKALSNRFVGIYKQLVEIIPFMPESTKVMLLLRASHYVRKLAHFTIYALLGGVVSVGLGKIGLKRSESVCLAILLCVTYAASDELHQYYVAGRGMQLSDVWLDTIGATTGILLNQLIGEILWAKSRSKRGRYMRTSISRTSYLKKR